MQNRLDLRVGVIRGGPSPEYDMSLVTGEHILKTLRKKYKVRDVLIDRSGRWFVEGQEKKPANALKHCDVVVNALHGTYGEDGQVQKILDHLKIPYTGSKAFASFRAMHKSLAKEVYEKSKLRTPDFFHVKEGDMSRRKLFNIYNKFPKCVVKPISCGSSLGISLVQDFDEFEKAILAAYELSPTVLVEEYIQGREATCGIVQGADGAPRPLPIIEIIGTDGLYNYDAKYDGGVKEICPGDFDSTDVVEIQDAALQAHIALGLSHYSRSDFIVSPKGIYILETNSLPGLSSGSLFPKALKAAEISLEEFLDHLLQISA